MFFDMLGILLLFMVSLTAAWLLWRYAPERKWPIVRFGARVGALTLWLYCFLLLVALFGARPWISERLASGVPVWAVGPLVWGVWGGWRWLHVGDWISGRRFGG